MRAVLVQYGLRQVTPQGPNKDQRKGKPVLSVQPVLQMSESITSSTCCVPNPAWGYAGHPNAIVAPLQG